jgi:uncharacterized membrane protein
MAITRAITGVIPRRIRRIVGARPRIFIAVLSAAVIFAALPATIPGPIRFVLAWDLCAALYMCLTGTMMARSPEKLRYRAQIEDSSQWVILGLMVFATAASLLAIGFVLHDAKQQSGWAAISHEILAGGTILLSWGFTHLLFAIHYAHGYYGDADDDENDDDSGDSAEVAGGLSFPGEENPDYLDFLYFSFVVGMTCQVSDVQVTGRIMRRLTLGHGVISFLFNTVILALSINLLAGLL